MGILERALVVTDSPAPSRPLNVYGESGKPCGAAEEPLYGPEDLRMVDDEINIRIVQARLMQNVVVTLVGT